MIAITIIAAVVGFAAESHAQVGAELVIDGEIYEIAARQIVHLDTRERYEVEFPTRPNNGMVTVHREACSGLARDDHDATEIDGFPTLISEGQTVSHTIRGDTLTLSGLTYAAASIILGPKICATVGFYLTHDVEPEAADIRDSGFFDRIDAQRDAVRELLSYVRIRRW